MPGPEYFDSTVAVAAIFPGSTNYADASARLKAAGNDAVIINHGLAEVYRTLTGRLKLPPKAAAQLVEGVLLARFKEAALSRDDYARVVKTMAQRNLSGPIIYDALHAEGARQAGAAVVNTYNPEHFRKVAPDLTLAWPGYISYPSSRRRHPAPSRLRKECALTSATTLCRRIVRSGKYPG